MRRDQEARRQTQPRVDWWAVLHELNRLGITVAAAAHQIGVPKATVLGWKNAGAEPRHADGEALVALWSRVTNKPADAVPKTNAPAWLG